MSSDRNRLLLVIDDGSQLKLGYALRYHAQRLLLDSNVSLHAGQSVTLTPLCDESNVDMHQIPGVVLHSYEDPRPNRPEQRYMVALAIDAGVRLHAALRDEIDRSCLASMRRGPRDQTHGPEVLDMAHWA